MIASADTPTGPQGGARNDARSRTLLAIVEPPAPAGDAAATAARIAFAAESARLAAALGVEVRFITWPDTADLDPEAIAAALADVARPSAPIAILVQDTDDGRRLAPLVARALGTGAVLGCSDARPAADGLTLTSPVYGGWLEQEVWAAEGFAPVATLDLTGLEPPESAAAQAAAALAEAEVVPVTPDATPRVRHLETVPPDASSVDLVHATRIVTAGMGSADERLLAAVRELADLLQGSVGATRPVVDEGKLPKERLIGQTGRTVAPELYMALGVSGSPHHVAGVRRADRVISINRDVRAPIFQFSDIGYVADLTEVLPALIEKIRAWRDAPMPGAAPGGGA